MKNEDGCKYETMDHFICTYTHICEFFETDEKNQLLNKIGMMILIEVVVIMMVMMDFVAIQDLEIRDFVLIVNSEDFIQERA